MKISRDLAIHLLTIGIIILIVTGIIFVGIPYVFGCEKPFMVVVSRSMEPTIHVNDLIVITGIDPGDIKVGDIIVFESPVNPNMLIVHRVIKIIEKNGKLYFKTKGDNNRLEDPWLIDEKEIIGKVVFIIPYIGVFARVLLENPLLKISLIIVLIVLVVYVEYKDYLTEKESI